MLSSSTLKIHIKLILIKFTDATSVRPSHSLSVHLANRLPLSFGFAWIIIRSRRARERREREKDTYRPFRLTDNRTLSLSLSLSLRSQSYRGWFSSAGAMMKKPFFTCGRARQRSPITYTWIEGWSAVNYCFDWALLQYLVEGIEIRIYFCTMDIDARVQLYLQSYEWARETRFRADCAISYTRRWHFILWIKALRKYSAPRKCFRFFDFTARL